MKQRLLYGMCIMILISLVGCGDESELRFMESVPVIESSSKSESAGEDVRTTTSIENSSNETTKPVQKEKVREDTLQTNKESERLEENESLVSGTESSQSKDTSQTAYSATIEKQIYLPGEECMSLNISDANELHIFLSGLSFSSEVCDGLPEYSIFFDDGSQYYINMTEGWIWRDKREARLTSDEIELIDSLIQQSMK